MGSDPDEESQVNMIQTDTWTMNIPTDWTPKPQGDGTPYFESEDGEIGLYVGTWRLDEGSPDSSRNAVDAYYETSAETLREMKGYDWRVVSKQPYQGNNGSELIVDHVSSGQNYRIVMKFIARQNVIVRAAFHHYYYESYEESKQVLKPVIASLTFVE